MKGQALPLKAQPPPVCSSSACLPQLVVSAPFCFLYFVFHPHPTPTLGRCSLPPYRASEGLPEQNSCLTPALCTPRGPLGDNDNNQPALTDHSNYATNCVCVFSCLLSLQSGSIYYLSILQMRKKYIIFSNLTLTIITTLQLINRGSERSRSLPTVTHCVSGREIPYPLLPFDRSLKPV